MDKLEETIFGNLRIGRDFHDKWLYVKCGSCYRNILGNATFTSVGMAELKRLSDNHADKYHRKIGEKK